MKRPIPSDQDSLYALSLLFGFPLSDSDRELGKRIFPSQNTKPTEKEAREALARILRNNQASSLILKALADHIDPSGNCFFSGMRRIEFKNPSQGHPTEGYHFHIASRVDELRKKKEKNAVAKVAKEIGKDPRHVARIYSKHRETLRKRDVERSDPEKTLRLLEARKEHAIKEGDHETLRIIEALKEQAIKEASGDDTSSRTVVMASDK